MTTSAAKSCISDSSSLDHIHNNSHVASRSVSRHLQLDMTRSTIGSQDLRRGDVTVSRTACNAAASVTGPGAQSRQSGNAAANAFSSTCAVSVGALMHPQAGAWSNSADAFALPVKPLGLRINQAPLVTAEQDAARHALRTNRLYKLGKAQVSVWGVHDLPFASRAAVVARADVAQPKGRRSFPVMNTCCMRDALSQNGRSPFPTVHQLAHASDRPQPAAASCLHPEGCVSRAALHGTPRREALVSPPDGSRRRHTPNKKDRSCAGGSISVDCETARLFLT